jgi:hypothetical protein
MKALILVGSLTLCLLGAMRTPVAAQASGPRCLSIVEFEEVAQFFTLPTEGGQYILTGQSLTFSDAYTGSGYLTTGLTAGNFVFSLASGLLPGVLEGVLNLSTGQGSGSVTFADTGEIRTLNYVLFSPPCVRP